MPIDEKQIESHVVYKIMSNKDSYLLQKVSIVPHGNQDSCKEDVKKYSASSDMFLTLLVIYQGMKTKFSFNFDDTKGYYMQRLHIMRNMYVRPPDLLQTYGGIMWTL